MKVRHRKGKRKFLRISEEKESGQGITAGAKTYSGNMKVSEMKAGEGGIVTDVRAGEALKGRLAMLNIYPGAAFTVVRRAPFGGSVMLESGGVRLAVRKSLAEKIIAVKPLSENIGQVHSASGKEMQGSRGES